MMDARRSVERAIEKQHQVADTTNVNLGQPSQS